MNLNLYCDDNDEAGIDVNDAKKIYISDIDIGTQTVTVSLTSNHACYLFSVNALFIYIGNYSYLFGAIMIGLGAIVALFGKKIFRPTICIVGALVFTMVTSLLLFSLIFSRNSDQTWQWITFGICAAIGVFVGLILAKMVKVGTAVLTAWGGVCLAMMLYAAFVYKLDNDSKIVFYIFLILMGASFAVLGYYAFNHAVIISTAIIGSYAFIRGISMYAGGFPNEFQLVQMIKSGQI